MFACALVGLAGSSAQAADRVLVMGRDGHVHARLDRALPAADVASAEPPAPARATPRVRAAAGRAAAKRRAPTFRSELKRLFTSGQIEDAAYIEARRLFDRCLSTATRLRGARRVELLGVIANMHDIAARGALTASRLPVLLTTLERNREWWTTGRLLSYSQRVEFAGSELVWEYYPGEGIELQVLGTFGKANGLWQSHQDGKLQALLDEMVALAVQRGPALAWEYDFDFGGGAPPWTSALSQATGIQALARASVRLGEPTYLAVARRALTLFRLPPPLGVRVRTALGARYLIYSYAPSQIVVNAFVQTLIGLLDYARIAHDPTADRLYRAGDRQARHDVPAVDTGAWSLYQLGGAESTLPYHELLRDFLRNLCDRTGVGVYCDTAQRFTQDLRDPPVLELLTHRVRARSHVLVRFHLSKVSRVGMTIRDDGGKTVLSTSTTVARGDHAYAWVPRTRGDYAVTLTGTDLAGNVGHADDAIEVLPRKRRA
jgi:hypothetical protein